MSHGGNGLSGTITTQTSKAICLEEKAEITWGFQASYREALWKLAQC